MTIVPPEQEIPTDAPEVGTHSRRNLYSLKNVHKTFRRGDTSRVSALDGVDLKIDQGEFVAIQGPTGQGKTTLLTLLGGLDRPTSGNVFFEGRDLGTLDDTHLAQLRAGAFGFVFQSFNLIPTLNALENVETALVPLHWDPSDRRARAQETLERLGLGDRLTHLPAELSGGQQQRVALARALVKEPTVLLADEPTGNLDETTRDEIVGLMRQLWHDLGLTLVVVTHDSTVARGADRVLVIKRGRVAKRSDGSG